jgi:quercetin dioxygenase-like cupin family protein
MIIEIYKKSDKFLNHILDDVSMHEIVEYKVDPELKAMREEVIEFENKVLKLFEQIDLITEHYFAHGVYARKISIPKDTILTGEIHKYSQINFLLSGEMQVLVGDRMEHIKAPFMVVSPPGTKRLARALENSVWITVLGTKETDPEVIWKTFIAKDEQEFLDFCNANQLALL